MEPWVSWKVLIETEFTWIEYQDGANATVNITAEWEMSGMDGTETKLRCWRGIPHDDELSLWLGQNVLDLKNASSCADLGYCGGPQSADLTVAARL